MPIEIPSPLVEFILLGPMDDRRQLQDSPILGDVWIEFGKAPSEPHDLLISPYKTQRAGDVTARIEEDVENDGSGHDPRIAYLQGLVVASLTFEQVLRVVVPKTKWWIDKWTEDAEPAAPARKGRGKGGKAEADKSRFTHEVTRQYFGPNPRADFTKIMRDVIGAASVWHKKGKERRTLELAPLDRFAALAGLILWAGQDDNNLNDMSHDVNSRVTSILSKIEGEIAKVVELLKSLSNKMLADETWRTIKFDGKVPLIWSVSRNRPALPAIARSVPAVKADAATTLFKVDCSDIAWAVLDSGIDGDHPAFKKADGTGTRVVGSFDFKNFRKIVNLSNAKPKRRKANLEELEKDRDVLLNPPDDPEADLERLAADALSRGLIHWELVQRFVEVKPGTPPPTNHGTHVAGIIGASAEAVSAAAGKKNGGSAAPAGVESADGMCPDISLFDFRVLGPDLQDTEFAIIAALQFIRYLNDRDNFLTIHGANLSLSIPHDVRNFACGRTPICIECERLIDSGVVVVAAAGNHGYKSFETKDGAYESYAAFSVTDPGNADGVITVGATHRYWPHTYGVSFFSSRGPTGDGRLKPDLVAPGERIRAPFPKAEWGELDGTSMAAPHVSGAAAMLLARYAELIGQPRRIKQILCDTATDLGRERSFQGRGMLDVLRALQSI
jgi:serine protease AprX